MARETALDWALYYCSRDWSVIPLRARDKRPAVRWQAWQGERATRERLTGWWARWRDANLGIVTGTISSLCVLDIDPRHGGQESLRQLQSQYGAVPRTLEVATGGGGRHLYFAHPGGELGNKVGLEPGIDLRGDGGYVVAPPSVHPTGKTYVWARDPERDALAPMPGWLLALARGVIGRPGHASDHWARLTRTGVAEGERNNTIASLAGYLLSHGVDDEVVRELLWCWNRERCRPPLADDEVLRTVENISRLHSQRRDEPGPE